jgi:hypothetical protein
MDSLILRAWRARILSSGRTDDPGETFKEFKMMGSKSDPTKESPMSKLHLVPGLRGPCVGAFSSAPFYAPAPSHGTRTTFSSKSTLSC